MASNAAPDAPSQPEALLKRARDAARRRLINEAENAALKQKALSLERRLELADLAKLEHDRLKDNLKKLDEWEKDFAVFKQREEDGQ
ncbi:uncharacterized protein J4E87_008539 [Alternaria ethzedia]|uniref:uncharacterized protein n=1 Tax=Alternaria ethzedia TaxID=181014 RepID=UPI0020C2FD0F|nr:uncharacterized protein J4E87_008539 [Alternaria ethzedia]KAI4617027.1 hypothetical protein J4E87_008539 [Alternaria ethzedia]